MTCGGWRVVRRSSPRSYCRLYLLPRVETIVERFGLDGAHVTASLRDGAFIHATATYLLLEERKG